MNLVTNLHVLSKVTCIFICFTKAEVYTAISSIKPLIESEYGVIDRLSQYLDKEEKQLGIIKRYIKENRQQDVSSRKYLNNPLNQFKLINRLFKDLYYLVDITKQNSVFCARFFLHPDKADMRGAVLSLSRVQKTYKINITDMATGNFKGMHGLPMLPSDSYEMGSHLFSQREFSNSISWFKESLNFPDDDEKLFYFTKASVIEHIGFGYHAQEDYTNALQWLQTMLTYYKPSHEKYNAYLQTIHFYKKELETKKKLLTHGNNYHVSSSPDDVEKKDRELYEQMCRSEAKISGAVSNRLKCRYLKETHPFLKLAPLKMEELYFNPDVYLIYEMITDKEIKAIKFYAVAELAKEIILVQNENRTLHGFRTAKAIKMDSSLEIVKKVSQRVVQCTGMDLKYSEKFQVANYGLGGYFEPHMDFYAPSSKRLPNRITSIIIYLSKVQQGGATVFTELGIKVDPIPGTAVIFNNLLQTGEGDFYTMHASCPILQGDKWILVKWFEDVGQELLKPCDVDYVPYYYTKKPNKLYVHGFRY